MNQVVINEKTLIVKYGNVRITSFDGIDLTNIKELICWGHDLTSDALSKLPESITYLDISSNKLTVIPDSLSKLTNLNISNNSFLIKLPDSLHTWNNLKILDCSRNSLLFISYLPPNLEHFDCSFNYTIKQFCTNGLPRTLKRLDCKGYNIYTLPQLPVSLKWLDCSNNNLNMIPDLSVNMHFLDCSGNPLDYLNLPIRYLKSLGCNGKYTTAYAVRIIQHNEKRKALGLPLLKQLPLSVDEQIDINLRFAQLDYEPGGKKFLECQNNIKKLCNEN